LVRKEDKSKSVSVHTMKGYRGSRDVQEGLYREQKCTRRLIEGAEMYKKAYRGSRNVQEG
jgi:hypothetical protein